RMLEEAAAHGAAVIVATHHATGRARRVLQLPEGSTAQVNARSVPAVGARAARAGWRRLLESSAPVTAAANGHLNGHANGHANGHSNGHANGNGAATAIRGPADHGMTVPKSVR